VLEFTSDLARDFSYDGASVIVRIGVQETLWEGMEEDNGILSGDNGDGPGGGSFDG
jgi:hypothetical protein